MPSVYELEVYQTENGRSPIEDFLRDLAKENQKEALTKIKAYISMLQEHGLQINNYRAMAIKKVDKNNNIWELRPGDNRIFFFHFTGNKFVLLHGYKKKSQEMPKTEIDKAIREMKDYRRRY